MNGVTLDRWFHWEKIVLLYFDPDHNSLEELKLDGNKQKRLRIYDEISNAVCGTINFWAILKKLILYLQHAKQRRTYYDFS